MQESSRIGTTALSLLVIVLALYLILWQLLTTFFSFPVYYYGRLIELLATGLFAALAICIPLRFEDMGIVTPRGVLLRSLAFGGAVALFAVGALALTAHLRGTAPLFSWQLSGNVSRATYFLVAPFQEILAKSVMLYTLELCFENKHPHRANLCAALIFGAFHVVYGIEMMLLAMLLCFFTGLMFLRERCVWGCAVAHFALGFFPACFGIG